MFPHSFARDQLLAHTRPGDVVLDPFSGRGTTLLEGLLLDRPAIGIDVNPVAACVTGAKARPPQLVQVENRLTSLEQDFAKYDVEDLKEESRSLPSFFGRAFYYSTLREILFLRRRLRWRDDQVDCFVAALVLGSLHGEMDKSSSYFSNQMPRTVSTKPNYSIQYWRKNNLWARKRRTFALLRERARLRLGAGMPRMVGLSVLGDSRRATRLLPQHWGDIAAIVTSPPYLNVTNYEEDQWLRLWFLGESLGPRMDGFQRTIAIRVQHLTGDSCHRSGRASPHF